MGGLWTINNLGRSSGTPKCVINWCNLLHTRVDSSAVIWFEYQPEKKIFYSLSLLLFSKRKEKLLLADEVCLYKIGRSFYEDVVLKLEFCFLGSFVPSEKGEKGDVNAFFPGSPEAVIWLCVFSLKISNRTRPLFYSHIDRWESQMDKSVISDQCSKWWKEKKNTFPHLTFKVTTSFSFLFFIIEIQLRLVLSRRKREKVAGPGGRRPAELSLVEREKKNAAVCGTGLYIICTYKKWNCIFIYKYPLSHFFFLGGGRVPQRERDERDG